MRKLLLFMLLLAPMKTWADAEKIPNYVFVATEWQAGDPARISPENITVDEYANTITVDMFGDQNVNLQFKGIDYNVPAENKYFVVQATGCTPDGAQLWWMNNDWIGTIAPEVYSVGDETLYAWPLEGLKKDGGSGEPITLASDTDDALFNYNSQWSTCFGLTLADPNTPAVITNIGFTSQLPESAVEAVVYSGETGDCTWQLDTGTGVLTISGIGKMGDSPSYLTYDALIKTVVIEAGVTDIGYKAFRGCDELTSISIPQSVTTIHSYAFYGCKFLESINLPSSITTIESHAFYNCSYLTNINIPYGVTTINNCTFENCNHLKSIVIPNSVTKIGDQAFANCGFTSIELPSSLEEIGMRAFYACSSLKSIEIPSSVYRISYDPFIYCYHLQSIVFYDDFSSFADRFKSSAIPSECILYVPSGTRQNYINKGWSNIFPGGIIEFELNGSDDFPNPCYLRNVSTNKFLGAGNNWDTQASLVDEYQYVKLQKLFNGRYTIESMVEFEGMHYLGKVEGGLYYMDTNPSELNIEKSGNNYLISLDGKYLGYDGSSTVLATNLSANNRNALWQIMTEEDVLQEQKSIMQSATSNNPADVTFLIKDAGFGRHRRDASQVWSMIADNQNLGEGANEDIHNSCAESYHTPFSLSQTINNLPAGSYKLSVQGFYRQDGTDNEHLPYFFMNNEKQQFNKLNGTDNNMWDAALSFLNGLYKVEPIYVDLENNGTLTVGAKLEENSNLWCIWDNFQLTYYGDNSFDENSIHFLSPTEIIPMRAGQTASLQLNPTISVSGYTNKDLEWTSSDPEVATVSESGLVTGKQFGTVTITCKLTSSQGKVATASCNIIFYSDNLIYVGNIFYRFENGFAYVTNCAGGVPANENERLEYSGTVNIPEKTTYDGVQYTVIGIDQYAFFNMTNLQAVVIPKTITSLGYRSFEKSPNLAKVSFANKNQGLQTVGERAFFECPKLNNIVLPNSTLRIDRSAFQGCSSLSSITLSSSLNFINEYAFANCPVLDNVILPESLKSIQIAAFSECPSLTSITFPAGLEGIGASAFNNCTNLKSIYFKTNHYTMTIGGDAFYGCKAIQKVDISDIGSWVSTNFSNPASNPISISNHIYMNNVELRDIIIPDGPIYINNNVFYNAKYITSLTIPKSVEMINDNIFYGCTSLKNVTSLNENPATFIGKEDPTIMNNVFKNATLNVPSKAISKYKSEEWWKLFGKIVGNVPDTKPGDVNEDGSVDISDIVAIINQIAGTAKYTNSDVNNDKNVDISDIVAVINIIANQ